MDWFETTLEKACLVVTDGAHNSPKSVDIGLPMASVKDLTPYGININTCRLISESDFEKLVKWGSKPQKGDVLIAKDGATALDTVCEIRENINVVLLSSVAILRPNPDVVLSGYLRYYLDSPTTRTYMKNSFITGAAIPRVVLKDFKRVKIRIPNIAAQRKITDVLSAYDDLIEVNMRRIRILEQMAKSVYRGWFGKVNAQSLPEGWDAKPFGQLLKFDINGGWGEEKQSEQFSVPGYVIRGTDIPGGRYGQFDKVPFRFHRQSNFASRQLMNGDIVIEIAGGSKGQPVGRALLIGQQLLNKFDNQVICASFCKLLRPKQNLVSPEYLYLHLREIYENGIIEKYQTQSTGIINFKSTFFLEDNMVIVPEKTMMDEFTEFIRPIFEMIGTLGAKNANLRQTRDLLLPRLVSGDMEVKIGCN